MKKYIGIYGAGGFAREVAWLASASTYGDNVQCVAYIDDSDDRTDALNDCRVMSYAQFREEFPSAEVCVAVGDPGTRRLLVEKCKADGISFASLTHRSVEMSDYVEFGDGCVVCAGVILTVNITLGQQVHINLDCTIGHDVSIGDYSTLSPGVHVSGNVTIGKNVYLGTGAAIINGTSEKPLHIGDGCVVGAGSCVTTSLEPNGLYVGVPAKLKKMLK